MTAILHALNNRAQYHRQWHKRAFPRVYPIHSNVFRVFPSRAWTVIHGDTRVCMHAILNYIPVLFCFPIGVNRRGCWKPLNLLRVEAARTLCTIFGNWTSRVWNTPTKSDHYVSPGFHQLLTGSIIKRIDALGKWPFKIFHTLRVNR